MKLSRVAQRLGYYFQSQLMTKWRWVSQSDPNWCAVIGTVANLIIPSRTDEMSSWTQNHWLWVCFTSIYFHRSSHLLFEVNCQSHFALSHQARLQLVSLHVVYWHILRRLAKPARCREIAWRSNLTIQPNAEKCQLSNLGCQKLYDQIPRLNQIKLSILFLLSCRTTTPDATTSKGVILPAQGCNTNSALASLIRWAPDYFPLDGKDKYIILSHQSQSLKILS